MRAVQGHHAASRVPNPACRGYARCIQVCLEAGKSVGRGCIKFTIIYLY